MATIRSERKPSKVMRSSLLLILGEARVSESHRHQPSPNLPLLLRRADAPACGDPAKRHNTSTQ